ncbi:MAG: VanZ family protein [Rhodothermaceae bacterium]|nr:VanZ family protein [Rhodothermaceae bacterium]
MPLFTSERERTLWLWTLAVLVAIYSTLGPARVLVEVLEAHNLARAMAIGLFILIAGGVIWWWIKRRPGWREIVVLFCVGFAYWMVWVRMQSWAERTHLIEYGIVAALIHQALQERSRNGKGTALPVSALAMMLTAMLGTIDECIQAFLPNRVFDGRDIFFNAFAGFMVVAGRLALAPQKQPGWRVWFLWLMACSIGWGEGVYLGWFSSDEPKTLQSIPPVMLAGYMGVVAGGLLIGVLQWLVLRWHVNQAIRWVGANALGVVLIGGVIFGVGILDSTAGWLIGVSLVGVVLGVLQWAVIRKVLPRAGWWVLASSLAWGIGMPAGDAVGPPGLGAVYGAITGAAIVLLLRQRSISVHADSREE